jgi:hypothetical protein
MKILLLPHKKQSETRNSSEKCNAEQRIDTIPIRRFSISARRYYQDEGEIEYAIIAIST